MKTFIVEMKEIWIQKVRVVAEDEHEAKKKVADGDGDFVGLAEGEKIPEREGFEFQCSSDSDDWEVYEEGSENVE